MFSYRSARHILTPFTRPPTRAFKFTPLRWNIPPSNAPKPPPDIKPPPNDIPSQLRLYSKQGLDTVRQRSQSLLDRATHEISQLGAYLNHVTGYDEVEGLKQQVVEQESKMGQARTEAREAKVAYSNAVLSRSTSQRQLNDLLQRKQSWTDDDVLQFTSLVRSDHASTVSETNAKRTMDEAEERVEKEFDALMRVILARYHVEQVWSDKIRRASSYGSLGVMGLNLLVFVAAILFVEPWKRKRLAETFEKKVDALQEEMRTDLSLLTSQVSALPHTPTTAPPPQPSPPTPLPVESPSRSWWRPGPWWMWCLAALWHPSGSPLSIAGLGVASSLAWDAWFGQPQPAEVDSSIAAAGIACTLLYMLLYR